MADRRTAEVMDTKPHFTKAQILTSKKYANRKDLVGALLAEDKTYTADEADALIEKYLKGQVK